MENQISVCESIYPKLEVEISFCTPTKTIEESQYLIREGLRKQIKNFKVAAKPRGDRRSRGRDFQTGERGREAPR